MLLTKVNVDALAGQRGRWAVTIGGREYIARPVSAEMVAQFQETATQDTPQAGALALRRLLRVAFPWVWRYAWAPALDPVRRLLALEPVLRQEVLASFFAFLGGRPQPAPSIRSTPASTPATTSLPDREPAPV